VFIVCVDGSLEAMTHSVYQLNMHRYSEYKKAHTHTKVQCILITNILISIYQNMLKMYMHWLIAVYQRRNCP